MTIEKGLTYLKSYLQNLAYLLYKHITEASAEVTVSSTDVLSCLVTRQRLTHGANINFVCESKPASPFGCMGSAIYKVNDFVKSIKLR